MNTNPVAPLKAASNPEKGEETDEMQLKLKALRRAIRKQKRLAKLKGKKERFASSDSSSVKLKLKNKTVPPLDKKQLGSKAGFKRGREEDMYSSMKSTKVKMHQMANKDAITKKRKEHPAKESRKPSSNDVDNSTNILSTKSSKVAPAQELRSETINFPINEECTSLSVAPSGRHIIAGFTDGTLRLFDTTGRFWNKNVSSGGSPDAERRVDDVEQHTESFFDCDSCDSESESSPQSASTKAKNRIVMSKAHQNYGAVACQIHAKGVITSLLMSVACCEDGSYAFGGVLRGSTELVAVDLSPLEKYHNNYKEKAVDICILDLIKVSRFSDAKLKGFEACTRLKNTIRPEYRLFTGKGIKNMHIWSFIPPYGSRKEPIWQCLYDTPTNGNTIKYLSFRTDSNGILQGISKSDDQKLRIWDLSYEQSLGNEFDSQSKSVIKQLAKNAENEKYPGKERPKRPPYIDVAATEYALGVYGQYVFSGGDNMFNKIGVMHLDVEDIQSPFNHTELALPNPDGSYTDIFGGRRNGRSGRQQRGDLKSVTSVAGLSSSVTDVILELSDGSMAYYNYSQGKPSTIKILSQDSDCNIRKTCVSRCENANEQSIFTKADYNSSTSRGSIAMKYLPSEGNVAYGFSEQNFQPPMKQEQSVAKKSGKDVDNLRYRNQNQSRIKEHQVAKKKKSSIPTIKESVGVKKQKQNQAKVVLKLTKKKSPTSEPKEFQKTMVSPDPSWKQNQLAAQNIEDKSKQDSLIPAIKESVGVKKQKQNQAKEVLKLTKKKSPTSEPKEFQKTMVSPDPSWKQNQLAAQNIEDKSKQDSSPTNKIATVGVSPPRHNVSGIAVSPDAPAPKALEFVKETKKPEASIKKFLQSGKTSKPKTKSKTRKTFNYCAKVDKKAQEGVNSSKASVSKDEVSLKDDKVIPKSGGSSTTSSLELDAASVLCNMQSSKSNVEIIDDKSIRQSMQSTAATLFKKLELTSFPTYRKSGTFTSIVQSSEPKDLSEKLFYERRNMMMKHRASHERLRNAMFSRVEQSANSIGRTNERRSIQATKSMVEAIVVEHEQMKDDLIRMQQMEASALAAKQSLEVENSTAPVVHVSFPFPHIFENARSIANQFLSNNTQP